MSGSEVYGERGPARTAAMFPIGTAAAEARRLPRGTCPLCGRDVALRRGGQFREHRRREGMHNRICQGSGHTLEGAVAAAASSAREIADRAREVLDVR